MTFWNEYFDDISENLGGRTDSFRKIFEYLDDLKDKEIFIVETGCYREEDNYSGVGLSGLCRGEQPYFVVSGLHQGLTQTTANNQLRNRTQTCIP